MPWCPGCGYEYEEGVKECPDCKLPLRKAPGLAEMEFDDSIKWTVVYTATDQERAGIIHDLLEDNGINVAVRDSEGPLRSILGGGVLEGDVEIYVLKYKAEEAKKIIESNVEWSEKELVDYMEEHGDLDEDEGSRTT
jgi:hypothetical protein